MPKLITYEGVLSRLASELWALLAGLSYPMNPLICYLVPSYAEDSHIETS